LSEITFENMSDKLVEALPELKLAYEKELEWWRGEEAGAHNIYSEILNPFLISLLQSESRSQAEEQILKRAFAFLEGLANHSEPHVQEVVGATVIERLYGAGLLEKARRYMGPATLQMSREIEEWEPTKESSVTSQM
jgi:hypothetical protein